MRLNQNLERYLKIQILYLFESDKLDEEKLNSKEKKKKYIYLQMISKFIV